MLKVLEGFHHWEARHIMGMMGKRVAGGEWEYPLVVVSLEVAGLRSMYEYSWRLQVTMVAKVACRHIYELHTETERRTGTIRMIRWQDQDVVQEYEE